jgi:hypothetical protein
MAEPVALKYRAFISYSHADTAWAKWLHCALESFTLDKDLVGRETAAGCAEVVYTVGGELTSITIKGGYGGSDYLLSYYENPKVAVVSCTAC